MKYRVHEVKNANVDGGSPRILKFKLTQKDMDVYHGKSNRNTSPITIAKVRHTGDIAMNIVAKRMNIEGIMRDFINMNSDSSYGVYDDTEIAYLNEVAKILSVDTLKMANEFTGKVKLQPGDTFSEEVGEKEAIMRVVEKISQSTDSAILKWQVAMLNKIKGVDPVLFEKAVKKVAVDDDAAGE